MYYKLWQACATNWCSFITNQGKGSYKLRQIYYYKLGQVLLQIGAAITNQGNRYYNKGQLLLGQNVLEIGAVITKQGNYYKLKHFGVTGKQYHTLFQSLHQTTRFIYTIKQSLGNESLEKNFCILGVPQIRAGAEPKGHNLSYSISLKKFFCFNL